MNHRRQSAPPLNSMPMMDALPQQSVPLSTETANVVPEFPQSKTVSKGPVTLWSHFRLPRRIWEYVIFAVSIVSPIEISFIVIFDEHIHVQSYAVIFIFEIMHIFHNYVIVKTPFLRDGILVYDTKEIIKKFGIVEFAISIFASIPLGWIGVMKHNMRLYGVLSINRLFRIAHCYHANKFIQNSQAYQGAFSKMYPQVLLFLFVIHIYACIFYLIAYFQGVENSWIKEYHHQDFTEPQLYFVCVYFVITTMLTVGFGDLHPITTAERVFCIFIEITCVVYEGYLVAKMVQLLLDPNRSQFVSDASTLISYIKEKKIEKSYRSQIANYSQNIWDTTHGAPPWAELFKGLPMSIKFAVVMEFCGKAFSNMPIFFGMRQNFFMKFIETFKAFSYIPGEVIYQQGENCFDLFIFKGGVVQMVSNGQAYVTQETGDNYVDGEEEFLFKTPKKQSLIAITFIEGWRASREKFCEIVNLDIKWRKLMFMNVRHAYPETIIEKGLTETKMWEIENEDENLSRLHIYPSLEEEDDGSLYIGNDSSNLF